MAQDPILFGALYSVYVRIARLALAEKGVVYRLEEIDIFDPDTRDGAYRTRHPFGKIPAFEHDGVRLYEAAAIARYVDEAFEGPPLQPADAAGRARMTQIIGLLDSYAYRPLVWGLYVEQQEGEGRSPDASVVAEASEKAKVCLKALADLQAGNAWLAGPALTLADLHAAPMFDYFLRTPQAADLMAPHPGLRDWWQALSERPAMAATAFDGKDEAP